MATIIDALAITLALDATKFIKGQKEIESSLKKTKETAVAYGKEIETAMTATSAGVGKLVTAFLGLGAVLTGGKGVQQFITDVTKTDSALGRFARGVNMSTRDVQAFDGAVQSIGGSAGEAQSGIQALSDSFQSLKTFGDPGVVKALAILSSQGGKRIDPLRPVDKNTILDLAEDLGKIAKTDPTHASFLGRQLGLPPNVVSALMKGREEFAKLLEIQEKYAASTADIDAADKRQSAWQRLKAAGEATGRTILSIFTPALLELNKAFLDFVESVKTHMPEIKAAWDNFWAGLEPIAKPVFEFLKSALKGFGTFASDTFSLVKNAFFGSSDDIRNSWKKLFDDMNDTLSNWAEEMWEKIPRIFKRIFDWIEGRFNAIWTAAFGRPLFPGSGGASAGGGDAGGAGGNKQLPRPQGHPGADGGPIEHSAPLPGKGSSDGSGAKGGPDPEMMKHIERVSAGNPELRKKLLGMYAGESLHIPGHYDLGDYSGGKPTSFGPLQFHRGGPGSIGTDFEKETGKNLEDPSTIPDQFDYAAKWLKNHPNADIGKVWHGYADRGKAMVEQGWGSNTPSAAHQAQKRLLTGAAKQIKVVGNARGNTANVDQDLIAALSAANAKLADGYSAEIFSGHRNTPDVHGRGLAADIRLRKNGEEVPGKEGRDVTGKYTEFARMVYGEMLRINPAKAARMSWGGSFGTQLGGGGPSDNEHFDVWKRRGGVRPGHSKQIQDLGPLPDKTSMLHQKFLPHNVGAAMMAANSTHHHGPVNSHNSTSHEVHVGAVNVHGNDSHHG